MKAEKTQQALQENSLDVAVSLCFSLGYVQENLCKTVGDIWKKFLGEWLVLPVSYPAAVDWAITQTARWCVLLLGRTICAGRLGKKPNNPKKPPKDTKLLPLFSVNFL